MKIKQWFPFCLSVLSLQYALAQDSSYQTLQSQQQIPADFIERSSEKYHQDLKVHVSKDDERFTRKSKESFYLKSSFNIHQFLISGKVLFNDEVSRYLGEVLDELLKDDKALRKDLRIYTVKSTEVNAYTTENGIIFVNLGLLARLKNEAQLAFILSHEIIHYKEKHVINSYVKAREISEAKGDYRKLSFDEKVFTKSSFDKDQELEADLMGLKIFLQSDYSQQAPEQVFELLKDADFPVHERVFNKAYFEAGSYKFPDHYYLVNVKEWQTDENYDDSKRSHPNIAKRKESLRALLNSQKETGAEKNFIVSEDKFNKARTIAQFEMSRLYLLGGESTEALLNAYSLQEEHPADAYLQKNILKALYSLARFGHQGNPDGTYGERQRITYFLKDFKDVELYALAIRNLYLYHEQHPEDEEVHLMLTDLMYEATFKDEDFEQRFRRVGKAPEKALENKDKTYLQYAFEGFDDDTAFFTMLEEKCRKARKYDAERQSGKNKWKAPTVDKTLMINPIYVKVDYRKKERMQYEDAETVLTSMDDKIKKAQEKLNMEAPTLNTMSFTSDDVEKFNMHSIVQEWLIEKMQQKAPTGVSPIHNEIKAVSEKYGTPYFTWMGGVTSKERKALNFYQFLCAVYFPPSAPYMLYLNLKPDKNSLYFSLTFDVRNEGIIGGEMRKMKMKDNESLLQSNIYYTLFKLKH